MDVVETSVIIVLCTCPSVISILSLIVYVYNRAAEKAKQERNRNFSGEKGCKKGRVVGYKKLLEVSKNKFESPQKQGFFWKFGEWVEADEIPTPRNTNGIYLMKSIDDPLLDEYWGTIVLIESDGWYVEHENGYRVHRGAIVKTFKNYYRERMEKNVESWCGYV